MKKLLAFAVLAMALGLAWNFFPVLQIDRATKGMPFPSVAGTDDPAAPKRDFKDLAAALQVDMNKIPLKLEDARNVPAHAFELRSQLRDVLSQHEEYQVLNQVCELIIHADQEHSLRQVESLKAQARVYTSPLDDSHAENINKVRRELVRKNAGTAWEEYRLKTSTEVYRLLGTLADKQL